MAHKRGSRMQSSPRIEELRQKFHENPRRYFAPLANEYRKAGDPEQAIAICRAHLAQQPGHMSGHVVYGQALFDARRMDEAGVVFQQALALDPENVIVLRHLGDIARQRGDVEEARSWYSRALDGDPHDAEVAAYLAELTEPLVATASDTEVGMPEAAAADTAPVATEAEAPVEEAPEPSTLDIALIDSVASPYSETSDASAAVDSSPEPDDSPYLDVPESSGETGDVAAVAEEQSPREEAGRRETPTTETTPIVTRTLAELYLEQGYIEPALEIYRQLAEREPEDTVIRERITELAAEEKSDEVLSAEPPATAPADASAEPLMDEQLGAVAEEAGVEAPVEPEAAAASPNDAGLMEEAAGAGEVGDRGTSVLGRDGYPVVPDDEHFTETQLAAELWDTADSWGADLLADEADEFFGVRLDAGGIGDEPAGAAESSEEDESDRPWGERSSVTQSLDLESESVADEHVIATGASIEDASAEDATVAEEAGRSLTVREFFATLGSMRPQPREVDERPDATPSPQPNTAEAESPAAGPPAAAEDYAFADDAFASLFADIPVNAEDSRAAAALSGAVAHGAPFLSPTAPAVSSPARGANASGVRVEPARESEEDIRRFREWLDGLAES